MIAAIAGAPSAALASTSIAGTPTDFVFDLPDGSADATLRPYPADPSRLEIAGAAFEDTNFAVPTNSLTINGGSGLDSLTITGTIDLGAAGLAVSTERIVVNSGAALSTTGDVTLTASAFDGGTLPGLGPSVPASVAGDPFGVESVGASGVAAVIVQNALIEANRISLTADATTDASNSVDSFIHIDTEATATVAVSDSSLTSTDDIVLEAAVHSTVNADALGNAGQLNGTDGAIASIDVAAASTSSVTGSTVINAGGALSVLSSSNIDAEGSGDASAGSLGGGVAVTKVSQLTHASIDTSTVAWSAESVAVRSRADDTISSSSSSSPDGSDLADALAGSPSPNERTDGNANSIPNAGALSYTEHLATTEAFIEGGVAITTTGSQLVEAQSNHATSATANGSTADAGGTGDANAIAVNVVEATTDAWVGGSAELTAPGGVSVTAPRTGTFGASAIPGQSSSPNNFDTLQTNQASNTRSAAVRPGSSLATSGITVVADTATTLELVVTVNNDDGGTATEDQWSLSATGAAGVPGSFNLSQDGPEGYDLTSLSCDDASGNVTSVFLATGADIVCTFVNDDLPVPTISPGGVGVVEGDTGTVTARVPVKLSAPSTDEITVDWSTLDTNPNPQVAQAPSDFVSASGTVTFAPGDTEEFVDITVNGDVVDEPPLLWGEWGLVAFSNPSANATLDTSFFGLGIFVIIDDDPKPTIKPGVGVVTEGDTGTVALQVPVTLSNPSAEPVTIDWATLDTGANGVATANVDYLAGSGTVTFAPGETIKYVDIGVLGDLIDEPPLYFGEWVLVAFSNPSDNATLDTSFYGLGIGVIVDND